MDLVHFELASTEERMAACQSRMIGSFASQSASRECIRLTHLAIARSRELIDKPFDNPFR